jgi:general L-amino acid transport system substrate-binding protein
VGRLLRILVTGMLLLQALPAFAQAPGSPTLDAVKKRGQLICGVTGTVPGFSFLNAVKEWEGIDIDLCRAVAAAVLGDATRVKFIEVTPANRFEALAAGQMDMLAANATQTLQREAGLKLQFAVVNYYDGQAFVVPKSLGVKSLASLRTSEICVTKGTTHEANLEGWFKARQLTYMPVVTSNQDAMYEAFFAGRCAAVTEDAAALALAIVRSGKAANYMMLPDVISKEPLGPYVRRGDEGWLDVVRWSQYAMVEAEELELTQANVDQQLQSIDPLVQRLLGVLPGNGKSLGLDEKWAYNIVKQVGNYGESYERNVGQGSPLKFARGINGLWNKGGLMYALPMR